MKPRKRMFFPTQIVFIKDKMPPSMEHFERGQKAVIVEASENTSQKGPYAIGYRVILCDSLITVAWYYSFNLEAVTDGPSQEGADYIEAYIKKCLGARVYESAN